MRYYETPFYYVVKYGGSKTRQKFVSENLSVFLLIPEGVGAVASAVSLSQSQASIANLRRSK